MKHFHPVLIDWFDSQFESPTPPQIDAWNAIEAGHHALVAAPTGSGKTFAAFLKAIDSLVKRAERGELEQQVSVVYVSPLKALSNDIQRNLESPLTGIHQQLLERCEIIQSGCGVTAPQKIEAAVRTGDTPQWQRTKMIRTPPHILVTTPESLYILLTSESGRAMLSSSETLIIDEIHALVGTKRGAHLALSMERLQSLCSKPIKRIGLSATQEPVELVARYLTGYRDPESHCDIIDSGHHRHRDLSICLPDSPLEAVMAGEVWGEIYGKLEDLIESHSTTLIFVNTRRLAERLSKALAERLGDDAVTSHHGSLAKEHRFSAEQRLKTGKLKALVATASLELGIDIGDVDLVCQIGSPRAVSVFLQRVGRSGHSLGKTPKGRLFPLSRDDLVECVAVIESVQCGELDQLSLYPKPLDVLAQQLVAEIAAGERALGELFEVVRYAAPFHSLTREEFDSVIEMLANGFSTRSGRRSAYLHLDTVNQIIRPRKGARLTAITNGGTIPDQFDYDVILQPDNLKIGTLNEDFSFESLPGDVFQLGNTSYMVLRVELGKVHVRDAQGMPPNIPFWFGEAPGRSDVVSAAVSRLRVRMVEWLDSGFDQAEKSLVDQYQVSKSIAAQLTQYLGAGYSALGALPTQDTVIFERFFDEAGDQHLVIHSAFGSRVNRAWGLALRKCFCRKFNFELQAAALEDTIVLSLGSTHSFPLDEPASYLKSETVKEVLIQALLDAPMFPTHWRWNASIALAVRRFSNGKKTPPQFQRSNAEDLIAVVFPDQIACAENLAGQRDIPDHPLVEQTLYDCLHDLMDVSGLEKLLSRLKQNQIKLICCDLSAPSPLSEEVLTAKPYAFLDDAPAEERRTALVRTRQFLHPEDATALKQLDYQVIDSVRQEAWPQADNQEECHDALLVLGGVTDQEVNHHGWVHWLEQLRQDYRVAYFQINNLRYWTAVERIENWLLIHSGLEFAGERLKATKQKVEPGQAHIGLLELVRMRLQGLGPVAESELAQFFQLDSNEIHNACLALENQGYAMQGVFDQRIENPKDIQWCERGLLARIHKRTLANLRKQISPVSITQFMRFLFNWQGLDAESVESEGNPEQLAVILQQLEGVEAPAGAWENSILPSRLKNYMPYWMDILCSSGQVTWVRVSRGNTKTKTSKSNPARASTRHTAIAFTHRSSLDYWTSFHGLNKDEQHEDIHLSRIALKVVEMLEQQGALFFEDIVHRGGWLEAEVESALSELVFEGLVSSDNFAGLRGLVKCASTRSKRVDRRSMRGKSVMANAGRWVLIRPGASTEDMLDISKNEKHNDDKWSSVEYIAQSLLKRYGVVFRKLLDNEKHLPPWRDLHYVYRRMEARREIRGGRFVSGFAGEQFALPEAIGLLRKSGQSEDAEYISISAADPLNLTGHILPGKRVPSVEKNRLLFRDGKLIAQYVAGEIQWHESLDQPQQWDARQKLIQIRKSTAKPNLRYGSRAFH